MELTKNFTLEQLTHSDTGTRNHIAEQFNPPPAIVENLRLQAVNLLQPLRDVLHEDWFITCAYRCPAVNKAVGGAANSQHLEGKASDNVYKRGNIKLAQAVLQNKLPFDQMILEGGTLEKPNWIHLSYNHGKNRGQILRADFSSGKAVYSTLKAEQVLTIK